MRASSVERWVSEGGDDGFGSYTTSPDRGTARVARYMVKFYNDYVYAQALITPM